jgi:apolipoprotein N-acyltransferase
MRAAVIHHLKLILLALLSAGLFILAWQPFAMWYLAFAGFVPLFIIHRQLLSKQQQVWFIAYVFLALFCWNVGTTYWVWNASPEGAVAAFILNTLFMCLPWVLFQKYYARLGARSAQSLLIAAWLAFEYMHLNWEISWPWLMLGNVFSNAVWAVQWYEYTGHLGGTLWVLWANVKLFRIVENWNDTSNPGRVHAAFHFAFFWLFAPVLFSWFVGSDYRQQGAPFDVVVIQPNIDPYTEKFDRMLPETQTTQMLNLANQVADSSVDLFCFPETALVGGLSEKDLYSEPLIGQVQRFKQKFPAAGLLTGADTYKIYGAMEDRSLTARKYNDLIYYDSYNTALFMSATGTVDMYHKSKLVPGVEKMPYPQVFGFLEKLAIDLGGTSGSLGSDNEPRVFAYNKFVSVAPVICYESVYGEYVTGYVRKGANLICVITNDGWWGNTPGYRQHFDYARLRAIETRRYIVRSANTGISGFIDDKGNVLQQSQWWQPAALRQKVQLNASLTFYVRYGDYIGTIAIVLLFLKLLAVARAPRRQ